MAPKNISIMEEAYKALFLEKKGGESFTQTIL
jgi:predicted CopG family antitoxin